MFDWTPRTLLCGRWQRTRVSGAGANREAQHRGQPQVRGTAADLGVQLHLSRPELEHVAKDRDLWPLDLQRGEALQRDLDRPGVGVVAVRDQHGVPSGHRLPTVPYGLDSFERLDHRVQ